MPDRDGRLESRGAANRHALARHLRLATSRRCARKYTRSGNPLFIPETRGSARWTRARALYAFGRHDAIGFSPYGDREDRWRFPTPIWPASTMPDRAIGAADFGTPGQRHHVRRPAEPERPACRRSVLGDYTLEVAFWPDPLPALHARRRRRTAASRGGDFHCDGA